MPSKEFLEELRAELCTMFSTNENHINDSLKNDLRIPECDIETVLYDVGVIYSLSISDDDSSEVDTIQDIINLIKTRDHGLNDVSDNESVDNNLTHTLSVKEQLPEVNLKWLLNLWKSFKRTILKPTPISICSYLLVAIWTMATYGSCTARSDAAGQGYAELIPLLFALVASLPLSIILLVLIYKDDQSPWKLMRILITGLFMILALLSLPIFILFFIDHT